MQFAVEQPARRSRWLDLYDFLIRERDLFTAR
jgi:hypothetical protein